MSARFEPIPSHEVYVVAQKPNDASHVPVTGKKWKQLGTKPCTQPFLTNKKPYEVALQERVMKQETLATERALKAKRREINKKKKKEAFAKLRKREENAVQLHGAQYITDTKRILKWQKKHRGLLIKMSMEQFEGLKRKQGRSD
ncbi:MAG: uncharacterized protein KVP18_003695 [Porospora cf. gigantea A]|uniref:uncharacterized protein n=1 Tax=Porospora cf. gigantea A TaxID=2853593 RepID=UPI00355A6F3F|nr:MAG: hypothetical protein KVP18_003695 [Porospora cf. gigantea A]